MNRRSFLAVAGSAILLPTWLKFKPPPIDLKAFCRHEIEGSQYDMTEPFVQVAERDPFAFATDGRILVRVPSNEYPKGDPDRRQPPATRIALEERDSPGWKPWPTQNLVTADDSDCPACHWKPTKCRICGKPFGGEMDELCVHIMNDYEANAVDCPVCSGLGYGRFPGLQKIGKVWTCSRYDTLARAKLPGLEYKTGLHVGYECVFMRFQGGEGVLMGIDPDGAAKRIAGK